MTRGPCTFRQQDVTRALKATLAAGCEVARVEARKDGTIVIVTKIGSEAEPAAPVAEDEANEWDGAE